MSVTTHTIHLSSQSPFRANRIGVWQHEVREVRYYYTTGLLTTLYLSQIRGSDDVAKSVDKATSKLVAALLAIDAVEQIVSLQSHHVAAQLKVMRLWEEAQDEVIAAILDHLNWHIEDTSVLDKADFERIAASRDALTIPSKLLP